MGRARDPGNLRALQPRFDPGDAACRDWSARTIAVEGETLAAAMPESAAQERSVPERAPFTFRIGDREVGDGAAPYVIAEIGANHNRDLDIARRLIDVAVKAGADAAKFQTYSGHRLYSTKTPKFSYLAPITNKDPAELLEEISLPREWQPLLRDYAAERGLHFFSTPFDFEAVEELDRLNVPVFKVASFEIVDLPLIRRIAATGRPMLISTGMATIGEVGGALHAAREGGVVSVGLMQCTSLYPAPADLANLRAMGTMAQAFGVPVGLSDHTTGIAVPIAAAALGAAFIEKHVTLDRAMAGPDHPFALEPNEFTSMVAGIREVHEALGNGRKEGPSPSEADEMYRLGRRSLVVTRDLSSGTVLDAEMITVKRPGYGIAPKHLEVVLGRALRVDVEAATTFSPGTWCDGERLGDTARRRWCRRGARAPEPQHGACSSARRGGLGCTSAGGRWQARWHRLGVDSRGPTDRCRLGGARQLPAAADGAGPSSTCRLVRGRGGCGAARRYRSGGEHSRAARLRARVAPRRALRLPAPAVLEPARAPRSPPVALSAFSSRLARATRWAKAAPLPRWPPASRPALTSRSSSARTWRTSTSQHASSRSVADRPCSMSCYTPTSLSPQPGRRCSRHWPRARRRSRSRS